MKTSAIIRIVLYALIILVLLGILLAGLGLDRYTFRNDTFTKGSLTAKGEILRGFADPSAIDRIKVNWAAGNITIQAQENASEIAFYETGNHQEDDQMVYTTRNNTLEIDFCRESTNFPSLGFSTKSLNKDLTIIVPADWICPDLELDVAATNVSVEGLTIQELDFDGASGTCRFTECSITEMDLDTASGDIQFSGKLQTLDFDAASASFTGVCSNVPQLIDMDTASGKLDLTLPSDAGFTITLDGMSTDFTSDFPTLPRSSGYVAGDGACMIEVDGMSCDVTIRKN